MSEQIFDLIKQFGGEGAISAMAAKVGLSPEQTQSAMAALMPALAGGMAQHATTDGGALNDAAATAAATDHTSEAGVEQGNSILGSLFGSADATNAVTSEAAKLTGIDQSQIASLMPMLATLATGALGQGASAAGAAPAEGGIGGMLGGILGKLTGGSGGNAGGAAGMLLGMLGHK